MKNKRKIFKSVLRQCRFEQDQHEANALAAALSSDNSGKLFWGKVNKSNKSSISTLLNSASKSSSDNEFLLKQLQCGALFDDFSTFQCSVDVIGPFRVFSIRVVRLFLILFLYYNGYASILIDQLCHRNVAVHKIQ